MSREASPNRRRDLLELPKEDIRLMDSWGANAGTVLNTTLRSIGMGLEQRAGLRGTVGYGGHMSLGGNHMTGLADATADDHGVNFATLKKWSQCEFLARILDKCPEFEEMIEDETDTSGGSGGTAFSPFAFGSHFVAPQNTQTGSPITLANDIVAWGFTIAHSMTVSTVSYEIISGSVGKSLSIGLYDSNKAKVLDTGVQSAASAGSFAVSASATLAAGLYYLAYTSDGTPLLTLIRASVSIHNMLNNRRNLQGKDASTSSGAALNSTLGTLTGNANQPPMVFFE